MNAHAHPMASKSDVASLNARYAPWRIEKYYRTRLAEGSLDGAGYETHARNVDTGEIIYRCEGWSKASRGQALNAILERRESDNAASTHPTPSIVALVMDYCDDETVTEEETAEVIAWCRDWYADCQWSDEYADVDDIPAADLLRGSNRWIDGGLRFVLDDVRHCAIGTDDDYFDLAPRADDVQRTD